MRSLLIGILFIQTSMTLVHFKSEKNAKNWRIVNDTVMGGVSASDFSINSSRNGVFKGFVSTRNNGGFAMVQLYQQFKLTEQTKKICIRLKGDGKNYQFRIKSNPNQPFWFVKNFKTSGKWETKVLQLEEFQAYFRGFRLASRKFNTQNIGALAFFIGNKKEEHFQLEIESITVE
ncbi:MAG: CIA30 family protein [Flavobacteriaceae bacterium]|nr:CIA30 family protein [Flavobacteriaceae bacterium]